MSEDSTELPEFERRTFEVEDVIRPTRIGIGYATYRVDGEPEALLLHIEGELKDGAPVQVMVALEPAAVAGLIAQLHCGLRDLGLMPAEVTAMTETAHQLLAQERTQRGHLN